MRSINETNLKEIAKDREYYKSPENWEDEVLYFLMVDRFSNGAEGDLYSGADYENILSNEESKRVWEEYGDKWNGGNLKGIKSKIGYLKNMGVTAIWISPIFRQVAFEESYHGYGIQNFLDIDPHFGTKEDMKDLVDEAHRNGIYIVVDIILNHTGNVFSYEETDTAYNGSQFHMKAFLDKNGEPVIPVDNPSFDEIWPEGGVWPQELMNRETFSRKGHIINWDTYPEYVEGDFYSLKNIFTGSGDYNEFNPSEALKVLTECYKYWIAYADIDGFRLDTVKHLEQGATRYFSTEIHEYTKTIGKNNFYIIGEITGGLEFAMETLDKTGLNAALGINKIPEKLENVTKGYSDPAEFFDIFKNSKLLGEVENKWYRDNVITMFDDHDMVTHREYKHRFCADKKTNTLILNAIFLNLFSLGIPCIYYGTEQGFDGNGDREKYVRENMFGGEFGAFRTRGKHFFDDTNPLYINFSKMCKIRKEHLILRQGRQYLREISYDSNEFSIPHKIGDGRHEGVLAWSRILSQDEMVMAMNCHIEQDLKVDVVLDSTMHKEGEEFICIYSSDESMWGTVVSSFFIGENLVIPVKVPKHGCVIYSKK
ncbi:alpha-amylase family glycosyl hydrolase [Ilyobacter sp.]|uniref:alpha-amylase family glycosyl hydrolase n=1 Tax=Ilyobacter sp. TaxID=3100343 RepID=UPI003569B2E0